jgi:hypothetical protein
MQLFELLKGIDVNYWLFTTVFISNYIAMYGTDNIKDHINQINNVLNEMPTPSYLIIASSTAPATIMAKYIKFQTYLLKARTDGQVEAKKIIKEAQMEYAEERQNTFEYENKATNENEAAKIIQDTARKYYHYKMKNKGVTKSSRKDSFGSKPKRKKTKTIRGRRVDEKELPENRGGGKRNTKKHYNKKKKTKKHAKKLHRKTKRG